MTKFNSIRAAKDYLAGQIVDEAKRQGVPLSEVERKMLYFSETDATLPDMMKVSEEFDRDYDQDEYEAKIAGLVRGIEARDETRSEEEKETWYDAVLKLCDGDHYLLVLINAGDSSPTDFLSRWPELSRWLPSWNGGIKRDGKDTMRMVVVALVVGVLFWSVVLVFFRVK
ncbi:MAG: hypothetical protein ABSE46_12410 [Terracidiphilus sp.]